MNAESRQMHTNPEENPNSFQKKTLYKFLSTAVLMGSHVKQSSKNCPHYIICLEEILGIPHSLLQSDVRIKEKTSWKTTRRTVIKAGM